MAGGYLPILSQVLGKGTAGEYGITIVKQLQNCRTHCGSTCFRAQSDLGLHERHHIPYKNVLFCENLEAGEVKLTYVVETGDKVKVHADTLDIGAYPVDSQLDLAQHVLSLSYKQSKHMPRIMIVLNNHGGQRSARKLYHSQILPVLRGARVEFTCIETEYSAHATVIARDMDIDKFDIVACCSGDGVPHEVINGFYQRSDRVRAFNQIAFTQLPCGTGNALSLSSHGTNNPGLATVRMLKLSRTRMDAMAVTQGKSTRLSFLSQAYGTIADSDIGTEHLRWMGAMRFDVGVTQSLLSKVKYLCDLYVKYALKDKSQIQSHFERYLDKSRSTQSENTRELSEKDLQLMYPSIDAAPPPDWEKLPSEVSENLNIFYVGKMPYVLSDAQFFPAALPGDGCMEMVITTAKTLFFKMMKLLLSVDKGGHVHSPDVLHAKIAAYRLVPRISANNHFISVDGESFPFEPLQVEVLSRVLTVLLDEGSFVDTCFTRET